MSMYQNFDNAYLNQYTDNAIKRGYEIYDEWVDKKLDSRKIVASAHNAVKLFKKRKTAKNHIMEYPHIARQMAAKSCVNLSASGSNILPNLVFILNFLAINPSR